MTTLNIKGKEYKLKFGYRSFKKSGLLREVTSLYKKMGNSENEDKESGGINDDNIEVLEEVLELTSKLVLAALQKNHEEYRADYENPDSVSKAVDKVDDLMDDYMDEEDSMPIMDLFHELVEDLFNSGFLSKKSEKLEEAAEQLDATVIPIDHRPAGN